LILSVLAVLAALFVSVFMSNWLVRPVKELTKSLQALAGENFKPVSLDRGDEIGELVETYNAVAEQVRGSMASLETRVADRTKMLETSIEVSRRLSTILQLHPLVQEVVDQLQKSFGYYHAHIYLFDEAKENLVIQGGTGEIGREMLANGHKIPAGKGLVGRAAAKNEVVLVSDTSQDPGWLPNPLLPNTRSELAVPISLGARVLGVLDVQQDMVGGITPEDAQLVQSVASQLAIAVQNAQAYIQAHQQAEVQSAASAIGQRIQQAATVDEVLQVAISELGHALDARRSSVEIRSRQTSADNTN
jgi:GAF domain-containing protein/HAMP domain-containing protein